MSGPSLPPSHPAVHKHEGQTCPVTGKTHEYCAPQPGDSRSPCPALNTMANHGYIRRDGKNLGLFDLANGLKACYGLSTFLAYFLALGGFILLKRVTPVDLYEIGKHGAIEHDASLVHHDTPEGQSYAPIEIDQGLVDKLMSDVVPQKAMGAHNGLSGVVMNYLDVARARVRREAECRPVGAVAAEIARGEMAVILGVWETMAGDKKGIPVEWLRGWIGHERLPEGWRPQHVQGFFDVVHRSKSIRLAQDEFRKQQKEPLQPSKM